MKLQAKSRLQMTAAKVSEPTATLIRNLLVKRWGAKAHGQWGNSNPYEDFQQMTCQLDPSKIEDVVKTFESNGWKVERNLEYATDPKAVRLLYQGAVVATVTINGKGYVWITGPKKAKQSTLPYYD